MAASRIEKIQGLTTSQLKPSNFDRDLIYWADPDRTRSLRAVLVQGGLLVHYWKMPWAGVIEDIESVQIVPGAGIGGQNLIDVQVGAPGALASVYAAGADGNTVLDDAVSTAVGTTVKNFPTAIAGVGILTACTDGQTRTKFNKDDLIYLIGTPAVAAFGTTEVTIKIAKEIPTPAV